MTGTVDHNEGIFFVGRAGKDRPYPVWRYHKWFPPEIANDTAEDEKLQAKGYTPRLEPLSKNTYLLNWRYDLEEMSARQLALFIKDEFDIVIPHQVGKEYLFKLIWKFYMMSPHAKDEIVFFAQTIALDYDEAQKKIMETGANLDAYEREEFYA